MISTVCVIRSREQKQSGHCFLISATTCSRTNSLLNKNNSHKWKQNKIYEQLQLSYLQRWAVSYLCKDLWETGCWPEWTFPGQTPLSNKEQHRLTLRTVWLPVSSNVRPGLKIKCLLMWRRGFTCHHEREVKSLLDGLAMHLVWQRCKTNVFLVLVLKVETKIWKYIREAHINHSAPFTVYEISHSYKEVLRTTEERKATLPSQSIQLNPYNRKKISTNRTI